MKIKQINIKNKFQPIELNITIESEQELCDLFKRLNISDAVVNKANFVTTKYQSNDVMIDDLWEELNELMETYNLFSN